MTETLARYERIGKDGIRHPSLVCVEDIYYGLPDFHVSPKQLPILKVVQIESAREYNYSIRDHKRFPVIKGYRWQWTALLMETPMTSDEPWYALVVGYVPTDKE